MINILRRAPLLDYLRPKKLRLFHQVWPYTMVGYKRLNNAYQLASEIESSNKPGAIVECGTWKGGCAAVMAHQAQNHPIYLFDSFEGLPPATSQDGEKALSYSEGSPKCVSTLDDVHTILFQKLNLNPQSIHIIKGWFQDTLPQQREQIGPIALLRLDGDWYESTRVCLEQLYDQVVPGGYVIIDDYGHWEGCRKAVDEFFERKGISPTLHTIDYTGRYFVK